MAKKVTDADLIYLINQIPKFRENTLSFSHPRSLCSLAQCKHYLTQIEELTKGSFFDKPKKRKVSRETQTTRVTRTNSHSTHV